MTSRRKLQNIPPGSAWIRITKDDVAISYDGRKFNSRSRGKARCSAANGKMDLPEGDGRVTMGLYELNGDTLRIVLPEYYGERPEHFLAARDGRLTLYVLKKATE
jgi:hypothetical protein